MSSFLSRDFTRGMLARCRWYHRVAKVCSSAMARGALVVSRKCVVALMARGALVVSRKCVVVLMARGALVVAL
jgi:hypothetical protein